MVQWSLLLFYCWEWLNMSGGITLHDIIILIVKGRRKWIILAWECASLLSFVHSIENPYLSSKVRCSVTPTLVQLYCLLIENINKVYSFISPIISQFRMEILHALLSWYAILFLCMITCGYPLKLCKYPVTVF